MSDVKDGTPQGETDTANGMLTHRRAIIYMSDASDVSSDASSYGIGADCDVAFEYRLREPEGACVENRAAECALRDQRAVA